MLVRSIALIREYMALLELVVFSMSICYLELLHIPQSVFSLAVSF